MTVAELFQFFLLVTIGNGCIVFQACFDRMFREPQVSRCVVIVNTIVFTFIILFSRLYLKQRSEPRLHHSPSHPVLRGDEADGANPVAANPVSEKDKDL